MWRAKVSVNAGRARGFREQRLDIISAQLTLKLVQVVQQVFERRRLPLRG
jgi:hypothetical protein